MYRESEDPWNFATDAYEANRYDTIMRLIGERTFRRVFEPGCSIGILTQRLAHIATRIEAMDISPTAVERAGVRVACHQNVAVTLGSLPANIPDGCFDLIVLSEVGYYMDELTLRGLMDQLVRRLERHGELLAAHWLGVSPDHELSGDRVHEIIGNVSGLVLENSARYEGFRIDKWIRQ